VSQSSWYLESCPEMGGSSNQREHIAVGVEPDDLSSCAYPRRRLAGDYSGATCHIEYALPGFQHHEIEESWCP